jgi:hypothetical protein
MRCLSLIVLTASALLLAACGGGANQPAPGTPERPLVATTQQAPVAAAGAQGAHDPSGRSNEGTSTAAKPGKGAAAGSSTPAAKKPGYQALVEQQKSSPQGQRFTPCNLVPEARAASILGPIQQPLEAPQGPTCIYRSRDGKQFVTVALQSLSFQKIQSQVRNPQRFVLSGHTAYCGRYGQPMLYVPLSGGRVLSIAGPCPVARAFAASAVQRLPS